MKIYVVTEDWSNGESYEDMRSNYKGYCKSFLSKEEAINYINDKIVNITSPHEYKEPEHNQWYDDNVEYELKKVKETNIESEIIRRCFVWNETKTYCDLNTKRAYDEIYKAGIYSEILKWDMEVGSEHGGIGYQITEEEL